ncbi:HAD-IB family hydrolase [Actinoplanes sp. NPDC051475]|uniref:HAD family hydrolase n=1 Tax=Actinoplanes sp. NPDC051475 TaxID=3157225 RepID=UPI00344DA440
MGIPAAIFDLDETLLGVTSIFRFLEYDLAARGRPPSAYEAERAWLGELRSAGVPRTERNRAFYQAFAGRSAAEVSGRGEVWFLEEHARGALFDPRVLRRFRAHTRAGHLTVLVTGSFPPCVEPIARYVRADVVVCTRPEVVGGRYTGRVDVPMVGENKVVAVRQLAARHGIDLHQSYAYGDDASDLPVLGLVGSPCAVGDDPVLLEHAERLGWTTLRRGVTCRTP